IGSDSFRRRQKIPEIPLSLENDVANDKQRPPIAQYIKRTADWTGGTPGLLRFRHGFPFINLSCVLQLK
ncbi:MAG: hypothetical protein ACREOZ_00750, partial [Gloeomargaritales cyanobacterium]